MQTIYLDISNRGVIPAIYAKQGDVGRKVEVILTNSGLPYEPEAGSAFSAWFSGASGVGNYTEIGGKSAFSVSGNKVTVELITQMLQNGGEGFLCLVLSRANGEQIGLWNIRYICEGIPGAGSEPAKDYYTAFSQAVAGLAYPDASLSVAGKAADAGATGKALEGKAPAQEDASFPGCYYRMVNGIKEWINPPMELGKEYRTTERWNGKAVYTRCESLGACPNSAYKNVTINTDAFCKVIDLRGYAADGGSSVNIPYWDEYAAWSSSAIKLYSYSENGKITITVHTGGNQSNRTAYAIIKYVKD